MVGPALGSKQRECKGVRRNAVFRSRRINGIAAAVAAAIAGVMGGCSSHVAESSLIPEKELARRPEAKVRSAEGVPPRIVKQIDEALVYYFGTPSEPRMFEPASEGDGHGDSTDGVTLASENSASDESKHPKRVAQRSAEQLKRGMAVFTKRCAACHGGTGNGEGPVAAYLNP